jgi:hypothetical protein
MKNTTIFFIIFFFLLCSTVSKASISVQPLEISIVMDDDFIHGNTFKKITVINNKADSFNVTWYIEHPNPPSSIRPNRTFIPDLSWIYVEPKWAVIPSKGSEAFYIYLDVPENDELRDQHWEAWVTFKAGKQGDFNFEHAIRVYIDTPGKIIDADDQDHDTFSIVIGDQLNIPLVDIAIAAGIVIVLLLIGTVLYRSRGKHRRKTKSITKPSLDVEKKVTPTENNATKLPHADDVGSQVDDMFSHFENKKKP